uniref:Uncharacterized protein n=1 Tax=Leersia perrieri TaxID=77586 RepID=A0A0D9WM78_9ORYZ
MFRSAGGCSSHVTRCIHLGKNPVDQSSSFSTPNAIKSSVNGWKKQPLGNVGPVSEIGDEVFIDDVNGEVPIDFPKGVYIRNGPNPLNTSQTAADSVFGSTSYMYYEGHGMLHAVYFNKSSGGEWRISYKNKYVDSDTFELERKKNKIAFLPSVDGQPYATLLRFGKPVKDSANTSIFEHAGRAFAVTENHLPYEIDISNLSTLGPYNVNGAWDQPFTSHPKKICGSGELVTMGTSTEKPYFVLGVISSDGERLLHKADLKFEEGKLIHDIGVTTQFIQNDMGGKSHIGVMPRFGDADSIIWFDVENHCSYHLFNCFEDGNEEDKPSQITDNTEASKQVVVRGCRILGSIIPSARHNVEKSKCYARAFLPLDKNSKHCDRSIDGILFSRPYEWRLNLQSGITKEGYLTSEKVAMDFPVINENFVGIKNKYGYAQPKVSQHQENKQLKSVEYHVLQEKNYCSGVQFVAKENGIDEDDGWIITYVHDELTNVSQVYIIDAKRFSEEPVAKITLPQRVPYDLLDRFINSAYKFSEQRYLNEGNFGPVSENGDEVFIDVLSGEIPTNFPEGVYIRNGHGMLHAVYFNKSSLGEWRISYKNKYVDSETFELDSEKNKIGFLPSAKGQPYATLVASVLNMLRFGKPVKDSGNTSIFEHAGRTFVVSENHDLTTLMELGTDLSLVTQRLIQYDMSGKSRIGVMPRFGDAESIIWFDVENHCKAHKQVVVRGCRTLDSVISSSPHDDKSKYYERAFLPPDKNSEGFDPTVDGTLFSRPYEWRVNLKNGTTKEGYLTDEKVAMDFPVINEDFIGVKNKYGYAQVVDSIATSKIEPQENKQFKSVEYHILQEKNFCSGVQFVAKENGIDEDDGWIITYVHDELTNVSQVYIIDAKRFSEEPSDLSNEVGAVVTGDS